MAAQTQMKPTRDAAADNGRAARPDIDSPTVGKQVGEFAEDVATLVRLQTSLLAVDAQNCIERIRWPAISALAGAAFGLACFPIALATIAVVCVEQFGWSLTAGCLIAAGVGLAGGVVLLVAGVYGVRRSVAVFRRSGQELASNLGWLAKSIQKKRFMRRPLSEIFGGASDE